VYQAFALKGAVVCVTTHLTKIILSWYHSKESFELAKLLCPSLEHGIREGCLGFGYLFLTWY
jgi:hypothetical protein